MKKVLPIPLPLNLFILTTLSPLRDNFSELRKRVGIAVSISVLVDQRVPGSPLHAPGAVTPILPTGCNRILPHVW